MTRILVVGPDGAGKSTLAAGLVARAQASGVEAVRAHWRPGIVLPRPSTQTAVLEPHREPPRGAIQTVLRLLLITLDFAAGHATRWRRASRDGLLIVERGWYDMVVDPRRYRLPSWSRAMLRASGAAMPRAHLAVLLNGEPAVIEQRTHEIGTAETVRQIEEWRRIAPRTAHRVIEIDMTTTAVEEAVQRGWDAARGCDELSA